MVIKPNVKPHIRKRTAVTVVFAPDVKSATQLLLKEINK